MPEHKSDLHEEIFTLSYNSNGAFPFKDVYEMPVFIRQFYLRKLIDTKNKEEEAMKKNAPENAKPSTKRR